MTSAPAPAASSAAIARAALRRLAEQGVEPTPEAYRRAWLAVAPAEPPSPQAREWLERLDSAPQRQLPGSAALRECLRQGDWEQSARLLWDALQQRAEPAGAPNLGPELAAFMREWDRSQAGLSRLHKLQALQAIETAADSAQARQLLRATTERWAGLRERPVLAPAQGTQPAPSNGQGAAGATGDAWKRLWLDAVRMVEQVHAAQPQLRSQAQALLAEATGGDAAGDAPGAALAARAQQLWNACEHWLAEDDLRRGAALETLRLLLDNVAELFAPQHWLQGQITTLQGMLHDPLDLPRLRRAVQDLKDLLLRQGVLQKANDDARALARELVGMVVRSLGSYVESTERYGERLREGLRELDASEDWQRAKSVVQGILEQSQHMLDETGRLRGAFSEAQQELQQARGRVRELESELEQVGELVQQDALTGALNLRGLEMVFRRETAHAARSGDALGVAMLDLDHFRQLNESYGHDTGDAVLRELVQVLRGEMRRTDVVARVGGEEFMLLLPGEDEQGVVEALQRAQHLFQARRFVHARQPAGIQARFSAGVACWSPGEELEAVYARVEQALLSAKAAGRDRIEVASAGSPN